MEHLTESQLKVLYINFVAYRDDQCNGRADMSVQEFYKKFRLCSCTA